MVELDEKEVEARLAWIATADVYALLYKHRFAPTGDPHFCNDKLYRAHRDRLCALREADPAAYVAASKQMGW